ncbi:MAG: hypothetical protein GY861_03165 [bacterium]|nr:hypothetical protein [bacterium]
MAKIASSFYRDGNFVPITTDGIITKKTITFDGATADAWGNDGGALDGAAIFTVTGLVRIKAVIGVCTTLLAGGATIETGITGATAIFHAQTTDTDIDAGEIWFNSATPATYFILGESTAAADNLPEYVLNGNDVIFTVSGGQDVDSGVIDFYCIWVPWSDTGNVVDSGN